MVRRRRHSCRCSSGWVYIELLVVTSRRALYASIVSLRMLLPLLGGMRWNTTGTVAGSFAGSVCVAIAAGSPYMQKVYQKLILSSHSQHATPCCALLLRTCSLYDLLPCQRSPLHARTVRQQRRLWPTERRPTVRSCPHTPKHIPNPTCSHQSADSDAPSRSAPVQEEEGRHSQRARRHSHAQQGRPG